MSRNNFGEFHDRLVVFQCIQALCPAMHVSGISCTKVSRNLADQKKYCESVEDSEAYNVRVFNWHT